VKRTPKRCGRTRADANILLLECKSFDVEVVGQFGTWTALDADSKLIISFCLGDRTLTTASGFMADVASRLANRVQLTTDGHRPYLAAVEDAFGGDIDYAVLRKIYGADANPEKRYSPAVCLGCKVEEVTGAPDPKHISTSYIERQNLTMRMSMRRFTRLTNAFSKKIENHAHAVAVHFLHYNFCRVHGSLRVTPAMEALLSDHVWSIEEMIRLLDRRSAVAA
jgi:IS1 family transposase